ncbi:MAG: hypothetical protein DMF61_07310 [Blastocatellia bacterium AA13]|nr:MAG: hypothetical protein DMF61_07310 [Blastocatellia bacterium AA13]
MTMNSANNDAVAEAPDPANYEDPVVWSIGIYTGETLKGLQPAPAASNPVLSAQDVTDVRSSFVADPFMINDGDRWHLFFEVWNLDAHKGDIGWAVSNDGLAWDYRRIVLTEPFHLSYPYVFREQGEYYMIPESYQANAVRVYRGDPFPEKWSLVEPILEGELLDSSIFAFEGKWWLLTCPMASDDDVLELFYADAVLGPWRRHPASPVIKGNDQIARPGGRVVMGDSGRPVRFTQACYPAYGMHIRGFEITALNTSSYEEREIQQAPILLGGNQYWNRSGMHHVDPHRVNGKWLACVDGWRIEERPQVEKQAR